MEIGGNERTSAYYYWKKNTKNRWLVMCESMTWLTARSQLIDQLKRSWQRQAYCACNGWRKKAIERLHQTVVMHELYVQKYGHGGVWRSINGRHDTCEYCRHEAAYASILFCIRGAILCGCVLLFWDHGSGGKWHYSLCVAQFNDMWPVSDIPSEYLSPLWLQWNDTQRDISEWKTKWNRRSGGVKEAAWL